MKYLTTYLITLFSPIDPKIANKDSSHVKTPSNTQPFHYEKRERGGKPLQPLRWPDLCSDPSVLPGNPPHPREWPGSKGSPFW